MTVNLKIEQTKWPIWTTENRLKETNQNQGFRCQWDYRADQTCAFLFFIIINGHNRSIWKFPGQGLNLSPSCNNAGSVNPSRWAGDWTCISAATQAAAVRSLTHCTTAETPNTCLFFFFCIFWNVHLVSLLTLLLIWWITLIQLLSAKPFLHIMVMILFCLWLESIC